MNRYLISLYLLGFSFFILSCSSTKKLMPEKERSADNEKSTGIINEFFEPLILNDEDLKIKKTISVDSKSDRLDDVLSQSDSEQQTPEVVAGFRVQICAVSEEEKARQVQRDAILKFVDEEIYLIYEAPYYKVRVGNCATRLDADQLQQLAVQKGFDDAWVVRTKIKLRSSSNSPQNLEKKPPN